MSDEAAAALAALNQSVRALVLELRKLNDMLENHGWSIEDEIQRRGG